MLYESRSIINLFSVKGVYFFWQLGCWLPEDIFSLSKLTFPCPGQGQGNLKDLYLVTKFQQANKPVKDPTPLTAAEKQLKRQAKQEATDSTLKHHQTVHQQKQQINCDKQTKAETNKAIMSLKSGKAAGPDEIGGRSNQSWCKSSRQHATQSLKQGRRRRRNKSWLSGRKEYSSSCRKRGASGTAMTAEESCSSQRLAKSWIEFYWGEWKRPLTPSSETCRHVCAGTHPVQTRPALCVSCTGVELPLYSNLMDYEKAVDSWDRETLWILLIYYGVLEKIDSLIQSTYQDISCRLLMLSDRLKVKTQNSPKGVYCRLFYSSWSSTGSWRPPHQKGAVEYTPHWPQLFCWQSSPSIAQDAGEDLSAPLIS